MIKIENLTKNFNSTPVIDNFNETIIPGEVIAILGKSGSGKSTLLNIMGCLDHHYTGNVSINGVNIRKLKGNKRQQFIREHINYLFQNCALVEDETVEKNLMYVLKYEKMSMQRKREILEDALNQVGLLDKKNEHVYSLSGGEQQRIAFARCLLKRGNILLADEPTGNLDIENRDVIMQLILRYRTHENIVIIVTHDLEIAQQCDRQIFI